MAAGESRIHAGFHIKSGNEDALTAGSEIGEKVWLVCTSLWDPPASSQGTQKSTNPTTHVLLTQLQGPRTAVTTWAARSRGR